jgi:hypothetical protein
MATKSLVELIEDKKGILARAPDGIIDGIRELRWIGSDGSTRIERVPRLSGAFRNRKDVHRVTR